MHDAQRAAASAVAFCKLKQQPAMLLQHAWQAIFGCAMATKRGLALSLVVPGTCIHQLMEALVVPIRIIAQEGLHIQSPCVLRHLHCIIVSLQEEVLPWRTLPRLHHLLKQGTWQWEKSRRRSDEDTQQWCHMMQRRGGFTLLRILLKFWYGVRPLAVGQDPCCIRPRLIRSTSRYSATFNASLATPATGNANSKIT